MATQRPRKSLLASLWPLLLFRLASSLSGKSTASSSSSLLLLLLNPSVATTTTSRSRRRRAKRGGGGSTAGGSAERGHRRTIFLGRERPTPLAASQTTSRLQESGPNARQSSESTSTAITAGGTTRPMLLLSLRHRLATTVDGEPSKGGDVNGSVEGSGGRTIRLVLASRSPRRRDILSMMGLDGRFEAVPSPLDEADVQRELREPQNGGPTVDPPRYAERLALAKATALAEDLRTTTASPSHAQSSEASSTVVVLGSDTIVELDGRILEKPRDELEAKEMLAGLSGREHLVHTGVAFACLVRSPSAPSKEREWPVLSSRSFVDTAAVRFVALTPEDIDAYVSTGEPMDKAGSYGIQGIGGQMVESVTGDFFTVMGLPMCRVSQELARLIEELGS